MKKVDPAIITEAVDLVESIARIKSRTKLEREYASPWTPTTPGPYPWQVDFHNQGSHSAHRALISANQTGKSRCAAAEVAIHLTGRYPRWWEGKRWPHPVEITVVEPTNLMARDIAQPILCGRITESGMSRTPDGTGWIPKADMGKCTFRQCGVPNCLDSLEVRHVSGGRSMLYFMSGQQGSTAFQGWQRDLVWMDEEPEEGLDSWQICSEIMTRIMVRNGHFLLTRTPLFGDTMLIRHFVTKGSSQSKADGGDGNIWFKTVTWDDAPHFTEETKKTQIGVYAEHEIDTRSKGVIMLGEGAVYPVDQKDYVCTPFEIPPHFRRIAGADFGIDHPAAGAWLAYDEDNDIVYVYDCYRKKGETAVYHAGAIKSRGEWIPCAWPHDGMVRDKGGGETIAEQYRRHGVNMLAECARYEDDQAGSARRAPVTLDILERMRTGRFKVFKHLEQILQELRMLHRSRNIIVAVDDDIESAVRYALIMLRYAVTKSSVEGPRQTHVDGAFDPFASYAGRQRIVF